MADLMKTIQGIMKQEENKVFNYNNDAFADVAMCIAAGGVFADGIVTPNEMKAVRTVIRNHEKLAHLDPEFLINRFDKFLLVYQLEAKLANSSQRIKMEKMVFGRLKDEEEKRQAVALAWKLVVKDEVVETERAFIERICGPGYLNIQK